jgi:hypothetical protein
MKRYFDDDAFEVFLKDFDFLFKIIKDERGELDIKIRPNNSFNLYYKGQSLAKIVLRKNQPYEIVINTKFLNYGKHDYVFVKEERFNGNPSGKTKSRVSFNLTASHLHPFFQKKYLKKICRNIDKAGSKGEVMFEQMLITDNLNREDIFIIDQQITETSLKRKRMDLLALKQVSKNKYHFLLIEVKLGNNKELRKDVGVQLNQYLKHINANFSDWKQCYEKNYQQIRETRIFKKPDHEKIEIVNKTIGKVVVCGYSGVGKEYLKDLGKSYPEINVKQFKFSL